MRIIDAHTHVHNAKTNFSPLYQLAESLGYEKLSVLSLQSAGKLTQNMICALCKISHPGTYAFGGLDYATGRDFYTQAQTLREIGFDGIKMLEGKPTTRRMLNKSLDAPEYDDFFSYMEETGFPVLLHIADPGTFWDKDKVPDWAVAHGWFYGEGDVPYRQYYEEVNNMLAKHPKLKAIFAHFYFLSNEPVQAQAFLDDHPNVFIDITAGIEMYEDFSKDPAFWNSFFVKNKNRIIYGTDSNDEPLPTDGTLSVNAYAKLEIDLLSTKNEIELFNVKYKGMGLPEDTLKRIFADNYIGIVSDTVRPLDIDALKKENEFITPYIKDEKEIANLNYIKTKIK